MNLPWQLLNDSFRFCVLPKTEDIKIGKNPSIGGDNWQKGLTLGDAEKLIKKENIFACNRLGIIGGFGNLVIVDIDKKGKDFENAVLLMDSIKQTFTVRTVSGGRHFYFLIKDCENAVLENQNGEIRSKGYMVLCAGSELCEKQYEIIKDVPIAEISKELLFDTLKQYLKKNKIEMQKEFVFGTVEIKTILENKKDIKLRALLSGDETAYCSTSEAEMALVQKLLFYGLNKEQVFDVMQNYSKLEKWKSAPIGYKELTFKKAMENVGEIRISGKKTEEKIKQIVVPDSPMVDFSEYKKIFENTHEHLEPFYSVIDANLGLVGKEYYPIKKALCYRLASFKQKPICLSLGKEFFDNRMHVLFFGGAGFGKGSIKKLTRNCQSKIEIFGNRTHIEQLVGKKDEKTKINKKGILEFDEIDIDECHNLLNETQEQHGAIMHELRIAMDTYDLNTVEKKQVDNSTKLSIKPKAKIQMFVHDIKLDTKFFDTGSFRRMFAFYLKPTYLEEEDAIKNFDEENQDQKLQEMLAVQTEPELVVFEPEAKERLKDWILSWNNFLLFHENQKVRALGQRLFFSGKQYFLKLIAISAIEQKKSKIDSELVDLACFDCVGFLIETIENYANRGNLLLSRDIWKTEKEQEAMLLEWLWYAGANKEENGLPITRVQDQIGDFFGVNDRQARAIFSSLKKRGFLRQKQGFQESSCWLGFLPDVEGFILKKRDKIDFLAYLKQIRQKYFEHHDGDGGLVQGCLFTQYPNTSSFVLFKEITSNPDTPCHPTTIATIGVVESAKVQQDASNSQIEQLVGDKTTNCHHGVKTATMEQCTVCLSKASYQTKDGRFLCASCASREEYP